MIRLFLLAFLFPYPLVGQLTDTTCIASRWIALKPNETNKDIFLLDTNIHQELDLVVVIKDLVERKKIKIYTQNGGPHLLKGWSFIDYNLELEQRMKDSSMFWIGDPYFQISFQSGYPMVDEFGNPIIHTEPNGGQSLIYPPPTIYVFPSKECDEIRIKENRVYNEISKKHEYVPVGLSFYFKGNKYIRGHEKFWIDLKELFDALEDKSKFPWYDAITSKRYSGFQYMQVSCYDDEIKY